MTVTLRPCSRPASTRPRTRAAPSRHPIGTAPGSGALSDSTQRDVRKGVPSPVTQPSIPSPGACQNSCAGWPPAVYPAYLHPRLRILSAEVITGHLGAVRLQCPDFQIDPQKLTGRSGGTEVGKHCMIHSETLIATDTEHLDSTHDVAITPDRRSSNP
jgi:hypothetical protein